ncbi:amidohydrolase [Paenalcaligenes suwonensis]|uniref:amidohydrolase n=1 Tax=Paenalcaligenes suwonensis TaxID=1202713 RepID=UPI00140A8FDB|nr:amidohydrolase [Paenalcaligenes suwonensis]NHC62360.1 amidohydrolase [Paenalcaligenes suwonensis]
MLTIFAAKRIITMDPSLPEATHIAVKDGKVLGVGPLEELRDLGEATVDTRFAEQYLYPGFVEGHSHALEGAMWKYLYLGHFPRHDPEGKRWPGCQSLAQIQETLAQYAELLPEGEPLVAWGFDPVYFEGDRLDRQIIDAVVSDRPVVIMHANLHLMTVNSAMLAKTTLAQNTAIEGVMLGKDGRPNGELREMAAMFAVFEALGSSLFSEVDSPQTLQRYARAAQRTGITTITDLYNPLSDAGVQVLRDASAEADYAVRLVPAMAALEWENAQGIARVQACQRDNNDKLHFGLVKIMTDGSIQGFSARMLWPGYHNGHENGIWNAPPESLKQMVLDYHQSGLQLHIHTNGDEAVELILDAIEEAQTLWYRADHRHTLQHCQFISQAQMRRAAKLGVCLNMFVNHIYYWGDVHRTKTLGYSRSRRMQPLRSALDLGIPVAMHSDAPVTPLGPLFSMWCAIRRHTASGHQLGEHEGLSMEQALYAATLGAAYTLRMDDKVGSLEVGKYADMVVLDHDLFAVEADALPTMQVSATVVGGRVHANTAA